MRLHRSVTRIVAVFLALSTVATGKVAAASGRAREKCIAAKVNAAGKKVACRMTAFAKLAKGQNANVAECDKHLTNAFVRAERRAGAQVCPTEDDADAMQNVTAAHVDQLYARLGGERFVDNGDGTIIDRRTGLQWEKKVEGSGCAHCVDDRYSWSTASGAPDGTAFTSFLRMLNTCESANGTTIIGGFAGYCDWRLPTYVELSTIFDFDSCFVEGRACVPAIFGPTAKYYYWSSISAGPDEAFFSDFNIGFDGQESKVAPFAVRAVRTITAYHE